MSVHVYQLRPRKAAAASILVSDARPSGRLWYTGPDAVSYAQFFSRSQDAVIRVYDDAGNVIETHQHLGELKKRRALPGEIKSRHAVKREGSLRNVNKSRGAE